MSQKHTVFVLTRIIITLFMYCFIRCELKIIIYYLRPQRNN